jgi:hypothetical protein
MKYPEKMMAVLVLLAVLIGPAALAGAQTSPLDPAAEPNYGTWPLADYPDPFILTLDAGGDVDAAAADVGAGCLGNVTANPDLNFEFDGGSLRVFLASASDTTLILYGPDGTYLCADDSVDANPVIDVANAPAGTYSVWMGTYVSGSFAPVYLVVTTGPSLPGALVSDLLTGSAGASTATTPTTSTNTTSITLDADADPLFERLTLSPGFQPDPAEVEVQAGGAMDVRALNLGADCRGYTEAAPAVTLDYSPAGRFLRIFFESAADTTLVVRLPDGTFVCNDDFGGFLDPLVDIPAPPAGRYAIWVGTFSSNNPADGTLVLTNSDTLDPRGG